MNNNPKILREFFELLKSVVEKYNITSDRTFNMDEKGFLLGYAQSAKVIVHSSKKSYRFVTQDGNRELVTVWEGVSAAGFVCPPLIIYKGVHHQVGWHADSDKVPKDWLFATSPKGWTDSELGRVWLERCFDIPTRQILTSPLQYRLLILDGHESHVQWEFIEYCLKNRIIALCLQPHSTYLLQPLDVGLFSPFNHYYGKEVDDRVQMGITGIWKPLFLQLYQTARSKTFVQRSIKNSFVECGIVPFCPSKVLNKLPNFEEKTPPPESPTTLAKPPTLPITPRKPKDLESQLKSILDDPMIHELSDSTMDRIRKIAKFAEMEYTSKSVLIDVNTQLRNANKQKRTQDQRILSRTRVLTAEEAQELKRKAEQKISKPPAKRRKPNSISSKPGTPTGSADMQYNSPSIISPTVPQAYQSSLATSSFYPTPTRYFSGSQRPNVHLNQSPYLPSPSFPPLPPDGRVSASNPNIILYPPIFPNLSPTAPSSNRADTVSSTNVSAPRNASAPSEISRSDSIEGSGAGHTQLPYQYLN
jgi:hypothetical protein